eukprot:1159813-Pelagomonas_calceolata.AAC.4
MKSLACLHGVGQLYPRLQVAFSAEVANTFNTKNSALATVSDLQAQLQEAQAENSQLQAQLAQFTKGSINSMLAQRMDTDRARTTEGVHVALLCCGCKLLRVRCMPCSWSRLHHTGLSLASLPHDECVRRTICACIARQPGWPDVLLSAPAPYAPADGMQVMAPPKVHLQLVNYNSRSNVSITTCTALHTGLDMLPWAYSLSLYPSADKVSA